MRLSLILLVLLTGICLALARTVHATEPSIESVSILAEACVNCHAPHGNACSGIPNIRGLDEQRLRTRLMAFHEAPTTDAAVMTRLMKGYDPHQISALAKWFSQEVRE